MIAQLQRRLGFIFLPLLWMSLAYWVLIIHTHRDFFLKPLLHSWKSTKQMSCHFLLTISGIKTFQVQLFNCFAYINGVYHKMKKFWNVPYSPQTLGINPSKMALMYWVFCSLIVFKATLVFSYFMQVKILLKPYIFLMLSLRDLSCLPCSLIWRICKVNRWLLLMVSPAFPLYSFKMYINLQAQNLNQTTHTIETALSYIYSHLLAQWHLFALYLYPCPSVLEHTCNGPRTGEHNEKNSGQKHSSKKKYQWKLKIKRHWWLSQLKHRNWEPKNLRKKTSVKMSERC